MVISLVNGIDQTVMTIKQTDRLLYTYKYEADCFKYHVAYYYDGLLGSAPMNEYKNQDELFGTQLTLMPEEQLDIENHHYVLVSDDHQIKISSNEHQNIINVFYETDMIGETGDTPDGIPDRYQVSVNFEAQHGRLKGNSRVYLSLRNENGDLDMNGVAHLSLSQIPTAEAEDGFMNGVWDIEPTENMDIKEDTTFKIHFSRENIVSDPAVDQSPMMDIPEVETPLGSNELDTPHQFIEVEDIDIPLARAYGGWSLINLLMMIVSILLSAMIIFGQWRKKETLFKRWISILSVVITLMSVILFSMTQSLSLAMVMIDSWTSVMTSMTCINMIILMIGYQKKKDDISLQSV